MTNLFNTLFQIHEVIFPRLTFLFTIFIFSNFSLDAFTYLFVIS